ncbi:UNVERIFIED_CONTAM: hypothetical protein Sradi_2046000 [Sesamum radiatum]|uniref:Uncharacterized protein n=1 Tax=Sesamum radiatum TaxID=300843 RepID=A0AAW2THK1_SESRA
MTTASQEVPPLSQEDVLGSQPRMTTNNNATSNEQVGYQGRKMHWGRKVVINTCIKYTTKLLLKDVPIAVINTKKWTKKPTISEVHENIRNNFKSRGWKS